MTDRSRQMPDPQTPTILAIAAMHDRAASRATGVRRLVHEECAIHLRLVADDAEFLHHLNADTEEAFGGDFDA